MLYSSAGLVCIGDTDIDTWVFFKLEDPVDIGYRIGLIYTVPYVLSVMCMLCASFIYAL